MGRCDNAKTVRRQIIERRTLAGIKTKLLDPQAIEIAVEEARRALSERRNAAAAEEGQLRRRLGEVVRALDRIVDAIADGTPARQLRQRMEDLEAERARIEERLSAMDAEMAEVPAVPHPRIAEAYRRRVEGLETLLGEEGSEALEALELVRGLIERIVIVPDVSAPNGVWLEISGDLARLLVLSERGQQKAPAAIAVGACQLSVDAGTGFEPVTFRL